MKLIGRFLTYSSPNIILLNPNPFISRIFKHPEGKYVELEKNKIFEITDLKTWRKKLILEKTEFGALAYLLKNHYKEVLRISGNIYNHPWRGSIIKIYHIKF